MKSLHIPHIINEFDGENIVKVNDNFAEIQKIMKQIQEYVKELPTEMPEVIHGKDGMDGIEGPRGEDGLTGESAEDSLAPGLVYRGLYGVGEVYYWTNERRDVVWYDDGENPRYYLFNVKTSDTGTKVANWYGGQWKEFGRYFSSVATGLLLAEDAAITRNLNVGGGVGNGYAGMSGVGHEDWRVRLWAGDLNRYEAPFRVREDGNFFAGSEDSHVHWDGDTLKIKGSLLQSGSHEFPPGVYTGEYNAATEYSQGDVVIYDGRAWIYINDNPATGETPADNVYWDIYAEKGDDGATGPTGAAGPGIVYRGDFAAGTYYYNSIRRDVVKYGGTYYLRNLAGENYDSTWDAARWTSFGAQFDSVATKLLLTEDAAITRSLNVGGGTGSGHAGMSGVGSSSTEVRIWAGHLTKTSAPFRVLNNGEMYCKDAKIYGQGDRSTCIGENASSNGNDSVATGNSAQSGGYDSVAIGNGAQGNQPLATAVGRGASALENGSAYGRSASAGHSGTAVGRGTSAGSSATAVGHGATASLIGSAALGLGANAANAGATALGASSSISGENATGIGKSTQAGYTNSTAIGNSAVAPSANHIRLGNSSVTGMSGYSDYTNVSDERDKIDINACNHGLDFILNLNPIKFRLDPRDRYKGKKDGKKANNEHSFGFSAQQVLEAQKGTDINVAKLLDKDQYGICMTSMIPMLVNAVKELKAENDELRERLERIESKVL